VALRVEPDINGFKVGSDLLFFKKPGISQSKPMTACCVSAWAGKEVPLTSLIEDSIGPCPN
jgi:hypothetical protein